MSISRREVLLTSGVVLVAAPVGSLAAGGAGVVEFARHIVEATAKTSTPIYLYNFPVLSGVPYNIPLIVELRKEFGPRIAGLKDSSGDLDYAKAAAALSPSFDVFPSNEANLLAARAGIFSGCISATENVNSRHYAAASHSGDESALGRAVAIRRIFDGFPLVTGIKYLLSMLHHYSSLASVLPPQSPLTPVEVETVLTRLNTYTGAHGRL